MNNVPRLVRKRDGTLVRFDIKKIERAIEKSALEVLKDKSAVNTLSIGISKIITEKIQEDFKNKAPGIENIQDIVETVLMREGYASIAKAYILYREEHTQIRLAKSALGLKDDLKLPINSTEVLRRRYLLKDNLRNVIETPSELFRRVAAHVGGAEKKFKSRIKPFEVEEKFYHMMRNLEFMPNSPSLMNSKTTLGQLSACFVLPVCDSIRGIFRTLGDMAKIHQTGGGTGFDFSHLRPKNDLVNSTKGEASGPVSFMKIYDEATGVIVQGGRRRGANMGILRCDHPDIVEFIEAKNQKPVLSNFNISVGATDKFMDSVLKDKMFDLINSRTGKKSAKIRAKTLFGLITNAAWHTGDPGLVFLDEINRKNPTPGIGRIEATNPCGELPLLPYESCNLASINLSKMVKNKSVDYEKLKNSINFGIRFLDNAIEVNKFPLKEIKEVTFANRKVGLGVMGFADMLVELGIPYASKKAVSFAGNLMRFIHAESVRASLGLAKERGVFPNFKKSIFLKKGLKLRNATVNTIAPTGTISIIAGCSSGIEPLFAISFIRNVLSGTKLFEVNKRFEEVAKKRGFYSKEIFAKIARAGSLKNIKGIPDDIKRVFLTAFDVKPEEHLLIQAAFQKYSDNSVSKTINLSPQATVDDIKKIYIMAYKLKCKGITIYRYGSLESQVLTFSYEKEGRRPPDLVTADSEYSGGCAYGACPF